MCWSVAFCIWYFAAPHFPLRETLCVWVRSCNWWHPCHSWWPIRFPLYSIILFLMVDVLATIFFPPHSDFINTGLRSSLGIKTEWVGLLVAISQGHFILFPGSPVSFQTHWSKSNIDFPWRASEASVPSASYLGAICAPGNSASTWGGGTHLRFCFQSLSDWLKET